MTSLLSAIWFSTFETSGQIILVNISQYAIEGLFSKTYLFLGAQNNDELVVYNHLLGFIALQHNKSLT